jgi:hypothetical protein
VNNVRNRVTTVCVAVALAAAGGSVAQAAPAPAQAPDVVMVSAAAGCPSTGYVCLYRYQNFHGYLGAFMPPTNRTFDTDSSLYQATRSIRNRTSRMAYFKKAPYHRDGCHRVRANTESGTLPLAYDKAIIGVYWVDNVCTPSADPHTR